ncbi:hypothetical protein [Anaeromicrobium sediminis]|uniref:GIY-YIG domain-containing protein n=1 Tax=Anaeromicrobium sediminis TaxID=1478221 RepID=A0A267MPH8_9FIRM|nr:hypothetical protein [Anaeromicrobium sediminis]PAB61347.1 hypothetical protein CCE28_02655 [Anaeromicrobium sediminis]
MITFQNIIEQLPGLLDGLLNSTEYRFEDLTEGKIKKILESQNAVAGVYIMYDKQQPVYIGRSKTLAQRIGTDQRSIQESQATVASKLVKLGLENINTMSEARDYMYRNYTIKIIRIDDEYVRTIFQVYSSMLLNTKYNNFLER